MSSAAVKTLSASRLCSQLIFFFWRVFCLHPSPIIPCLECGGLIRKASHRLLYLNTLSPAGSIIWGSDGPYSVWRLADIGENPVVGFSHLQLHPVSRLICWLSVFRPNLSFKPWPFSPASPAFCT